VASLDSLRFDNRYARLAPPLFARVRPEALPAPRLVAFNPDAATLLGLDASESSRADFAEYFGGARLLPGADPIAMRYAGHQFGVYVPQLGDGRALLLGEVVAPDGSHVDVQLKGSGRTPFSRGGDGRAVLRSTIREYLCSEAMHGLGIPTTRALCIVGSDLPVARERHETAAVLTRLAPSHVRFGSFEMFAHIHKPELVRELAEHVIACHFAGADWAKRADRHAHLLREVVRRTATTVAAWQAVGFAHGVMNTDNMSILGLTLDYGPFGFLDAYDPQHICNHSDDGGRYSFERQPRVALWNLSCLAYAFIGLVDEADAKAALDAFEGDFLHAASAHMQRKLGLATWRGDDDAVLAAGLLRVMRDARVDHTNFWRALAEFRSDDAPSAADAFAAQLGDADARAFRAWAGHYAARLRAEGSVDAERRLRMRRANPAYVLRNHLAQEAIERAEAGDFAEVERLRALLAAPFEERAGYEDCALPPPPARRHLAVSCSS
jgi:uncharacterized protein YdiU (UPF0061 family)